VLKFFMGHLLQHLSDKIAHDLSQAVLIVGLYNFFL
jgi:hypothetical protein